MQPPIWSKVMTHSGPLTARRAASFRANACLGFALHSNISSATDRGSGATYIGRPDGSRWINRVGEPFRRHPGHVPRHTRPVFPFGGGPTRRGGGDRNVRGDPVPAPAAQSPRIAIPHKTPESHLAALSRWRTVRLRPRYRRLETLSPASRRSCPDSCVTPVYRRTSVAVV